MTVLNNNYYVYAYMNLNNLPFYIGKGKEDRAAYHILEASKPNKKHSNKHKLNTIRDILTKNGEVVIKYIDTNLTEKLAFELECFLIELLGRRDNKTGILTNLTDGGEGLTGLERNLSGEKNPNYGKRGEKAIWWGKVHSEETKRKQSESQKGKILSETHKLAMRKPKSEQGRLNIAKARLETSYRPSEETKRKTSEALKGRVSPMKGKKMSDEFKATVSKRFLGVPKKKVECPNCHNSVAIHTANRWHFDNCKELIK
jgi:hypothetical protein